MAIITGGYDGTVDEVQFAGLLHRYSVLGPDDFKATTQAGDRIVAIGNGTAMGPGTIDVATNLSPIQFNAASGIRWDLVALRRDWQPAGGTSSIVIIQGGSTATLPTVGTATTQWNRRPGIVDDQPLYLQQVNGTLLGPRIDIRCWTANGGMVAKDGLAKAYLDRLGTEVYIDGEIWRYVPGLNDVPEWVRSLPLNGSADVTTIGSGWKALDSTHKPRVRTQGNLVHLFGGVQRLTGEGSNMLTIPAGFRPDSPGTHFIGSGVTSNGIAYELCLTNGIVHLAGGYATESDTGVLTNYPVTGSWSIE